MMEDAKKKKKKKKKREEKNDSLGAFWLPIDGQRLLQLGRVG
jgi:hypothetical protein